jgi:hypothetical protein
MFFMLISALNFIMVDFLKANKIHSAHIMPAIKLLRKGFKEKRLTSNEELKCLFALHFQ